MKERERNSKIKAKIRAADGATFDVNGNFDTPVSFGIYMLLCEWGRSKKLPRKKVDKEFEKAARDFLAAAEKFYGTHA